MSQNKIGSQSVIAGLDIGTTKVVCVIGNPGPEGLEIVGVGQAPNTGVRHGVVVNIDATAEAIKKAKDEAELMSGLSVGSVWLGISGSHIESFDSAGMVAIKDREVTPEDVDRVIEAAKAVAIPTDRQVIHVLPKDFCIDGQQGISDPIGMSGVRLESSVHIVTGVHSAIQNAIKCSEKVGLHVDGLVLQQLASAMAVLSRDEKNLGVTVVDIGGGTCDMVTFIEGSVVHTGVIPVGGYNFTHDVAMGLRTSQGNAEYLKKKFGTALPNTVGDDETVEVQGVGSRQSRAVPRKELAHILEARAEETLTLIRKKISESGYMGQLGSGLVLTGGASQLNGYVEMGDFIFDIPVCLGVPKRTGGLKDVVKCPSFSTAVGLLLYGFEKKKTKVVEEPKKEETFSERWNSWTRRFREYFGET